MSAILPLVDGSITGECSIAVTDKNSIGSRIDANVVGILAQINPPCAVIVRAAEQPHRTVAGIGDKKHLGRGNVADALRLFQTRDDVPYLALVQIDDGDGIVA